MPARRLLIAVVALALACAAPVAAQADPKPTGGQGAVCATCW